MSKEIQDIVEKIRTEVEELCLDVSPANETSIEGFGKPGSPLSGAEIKDHVKQHFIAPRSVLESRWLNRLQQRWHHSIELQEALRIAPTQSRAVIRYIREALEGRVIGIKQVTLATPKITAKTSVSFSRKPAKQADFVRGAAGFLPFAPGGLNGVSDTATLEEEDIIMDDKLLKEIGLDKLSRVVEGGPQQGLLRVPPGLSRGLNSPSRTSSSTTDVQILSATKPDLIFDRSASQPDQDHEGAIDQAADTKEDIDSLLPLEFPALEPHGLLAPSIFRKRGRQWAHVVDVNRGISNFEDLIPNMARKWPFELDTFQKEAVYHLENNDSVFVAAHTSAGKTVVAEYAIALASKHMTKAIYTSPIKALSNQKFRDFKSEFGDVGILTGDVQINAEASCLIMTTEILRSMLYRGADLLRDVEFVIFDEVHYVNDLERGVVWEEVLIMLPAYVTLIMLSATVPNTYEFACWVGRTKQQDIYVISTLKRPVPLEHFLWTGKKLHKIVDANKKFLDSEWRDANIALSGRETLGTALTKQSSSSHSGGQTGRGVYAARGTAARSPQQRGTQQRGRSQSQRGVGNIGRTSRGGNRTSAAQDKNIWVHLIHHLRKNALLPCCVFVFSKKRCEENADALSNSEFCTATEKSVIHSIIERSVGRLRLEDRQLPQIRRLRELLERGVAVHHGGLLPVVKEIVEILFAKTLVKVLFATETFAMGLNLPTRTVVFSGFRKHDGRTFRDLAPGEYTQMAGRAGRRGLDVVGSVIIVSAGSDEAPSAAILKHMILGDPTKLRSQFRLTYNMILNLLRVEALKIEEMIKRSFSENATQALLPEQQKMVRLSQADLSKIKREDCAICDVDLEGCHAAAMAFQAATYSLLSLVISLPMGRRLFSSGRIIVYHKDGLRKAGIIVRDVTSFGSKIFIEVVSLSARNQIRNDTLLPYLPVFRHIFVPLPKSVREMELQVQRILLSDVECVTKTLIKVDFSEILHERRCFESNLSAQLPPEYIDWQSILFDELNWRRFNELRVREALQDRATYAHLAQEGRCISCPDFARHFAMCHDEWLIKENIARLQQLMSDQNLQLLPDYEQRICVLKDLLFIDEGSRLELKGKVACEIHSADELVLTELILENVLADFEPEEIVALLSAFVFQEKTEVMPNLTSNLEEGRDIIIAVSEKVNSFQIKHQVILSSDDSNDFVSRPRFGLMEVVYEWARGMSFNRITDLTDVLEGTIVRVISRLDETCREVKNAARIIGDPGLFLKMQTAQELIKRDITAMASLYM